MNILTKQMAIDVNRVRDILILFDMALLKYQHNALQITFSKDYLVLQKHKSDFY